MTAASSGSAGPGSSARRTSSGTGRLYGVLLRPMFLLDPERIHRLAFRAMVIVTALPLLGRVIARVLAVRDPVLRTGAFGVDFPAPLGLAAGFDKDAEGIDAWGALGFGYAEVGTVTGDAQPGNPPPRLFRLPADRALINRMGFNNRGAHAAAARIRHHRRGTRAVPVGANIGKTKAVPVEDAVSDYRRSAAALGRHADFLVVNVSSPNTPGLRDLQAVQSLRPLLAEVAAIVDVPVLVKIAPDLADGDVDAVADLALDLGLAGIIATNTTTSRHGLATPAARIDAIGPGGVSGAPVADRSVEVLRRLYGRVGGRLTLVSVGGIATPEQAWQRITAGASLLQGYTGFIYAGPFYARRIHRGLAARVRAAGLLSLAEAVGMDTNGGGPMTPTPPERGGHADGHGSERDEEARLDADADAAAQDAGDPGVRAARAYIAALASHDASAVPLAPDAVRYEVGVKTGRGGAHIARSLEHGPQFRVIAGVRGVSAARRGDVVHTHYMIDTALMGRNLVVAEVTEEFRVAADGRIVRIDAHIRPRRGPALLRAGRERKA